jgi:tRNA G18 (ribose-2'-O)-methylase SpoU
MTYRPDDVVLETIDDPGDPRVADYVGLSDAEARRRVEGSSWVEAPDGGFGFFVAEGSLVIRHLVRSPYRVRSFLVTERGLRALAPVLRGRGPTSIGAPVYLATQSVMEAIAGFKFHRGSLAAADRRRLPEPAALVAGDDPLLPRRILLVEGVGDHENLGALFRNAAAFGVDAVLLDPTTCDPLYRRSVRVSAGHVLRLPFARMSDWPDGAIAALRAQGYEVVALTPSPSADDVRTLPTHPRRALLVGAEGNGLSARALAAADRRVRITMSPAVDSLNVATAAAIALHHLMG